MALSTDELKQIAVSNFQLPIDTDLARITISQDGNVYKVELDGVYQGEMGLDGSPIPDPFPLEDY